jgi:hypothetical protein
VIRFNEEGPDGLVNKSSPGAPGKLTEEHKAFLVRLVEEGPIPAVDGVVRWRACDLIKRLYEEFGISVSDDTLRLHSACRPWAGLARRGKKRRRLGAWSVEAGEGRLASAKASGDRGGPSAHLFDEPPQGMKNIRQRLSRARLRKKHDEIDGMTRVKSNADLRLTFEAADARTMPGPRIEDHDRRLRWIETILQAIVAHAGDAEESVI